MPITFYSLRACLYDLGTPGCPGDRDVSLKPKTNFVCINSIPTDVVSFCFLFGRSFHVRRRFKFHFTSSWCTGILRLHGQSLSRLTGISVASTGTSRSPYKRNRENNSKLSTSRDPGRPGHPGTRDHINRP